MTNCVCCGSSIPEDQRTCSMCYGDISHGKDGHYDRWAREQVEAEEQSVAEEKAKP